jgi:hypothetical protein
LGGGDSFPDVTIKAEGIFVPGYFTSHLIPWQNINDVVLRADYITVFKRNNKDLQLEVLKVISDEEIEEINEYSRQQLTTNIQQPLYT